MGREVVSLPGSKSAGHGEEDDFLVRPFFAGVVFLGTAAGGGVGVGDGRPAAVLLLDAVQLHAYGGGVRRREAYSNLTPSGRESPTLRGAMMIVGL